MRVEKNFELLKNISSVGIILRPESPELKDVYQNIKDLFKVNIDTLLEKESAKMIDSDGFEFDDICKKVDFLISVGGDGTLLGVVRHLLNIIFQF